VLRRLPVPTDAQFSVVILTYLDVSRKQDDFAVVFSSFSKIQHRHPGKIVSQSSDSLCRISIFPGKDAQIFEYS